MSRKFNYWLCLSILCFVIGFIVYQCYRKPSHNWDTLAYAAVILNYEEKDPEKVHRMVYDLGREQIPEREYAHMVDTTHQLRRDVLQDPSAFFQFLSYFRVKPLYTFLSYITYKIGIPLIKAPIVPSLVAYFALGILVFTWLLKHFPYWLSFLFSLGVLCSPPVIESARLATPDALSAFITLLALFFLLARKSVYWIILLLTLSILVRPENILLSVFIVIGLFVSPVSPQFCSMNKIVLGLVIIFWIVYGVLIYRYASIGDGFEAFYGGLSKKSNPLILLRDSFKGLATIQTSFLPILVSVCGALLFHKRLPFTYKDLDIYQLLFVIIVAYTIVKYIVFPDLTTRLHLPLYMTLYVFILIQSEQLISKVRKSKSV